MIKENLNNYKGIKDNNIDTAYRRLKNNKRQRRNLIKNRLIHMLMKTDDVYFVTFTLKRLDNYSERYIQLLAKDFLDSDYINDYIANIDYSPITNKQHIHAIVCYNKFHFSSWLHGITHYRKININTKSVKSLTNYILKLISHSDKKSATKIFRKSGYKNMSLYKIKNIFGVTKRGKEIIKLLDNF